MKLSKKVVLSLTSALLAGGLLAGCAQNEAADKPAEPAKAPAAVTTESADSDDSADSANAEEEAPKGAVAANARPDECGLQEQTGPVASFGPFDAGVAYFQPGQMFDNPDSTMKMLDYDKSQMHLEFDLKANEYATNWGYSVDETPAALTIMYQLANAKGDVLATGQMMEMNAIDGSHYGVNLPKDTIKEPGDYVLTATIYPPKNYDLHQDYITGPPARGWFKPLTVNMPWKLSQENLDIVKKNTVDNFMEPSEKCKAYPVKLYKDPAAEKAQAEAEATTPLPQK